MTTDRCPTCESPEPKLHPAVQHEGEVQLCNDAYHQAAEPTADKQVNQLLEAICKAQEERDRQNVIIDQTTKALDKLTTIDRSEPNSAFVHGDYIISIDNTYSMIPSLRYKVKRRAQLPIGLTLEAPAVKAIESKSHGFTATFVPK